MFSNPVEARARELQEESSRPGPRAFPGTVRSILPALRIITSWIREKKREKEKRYTNLRLVRIIDCESLLLQLKLLRGCSMLDIFMKGWIN